jgi:hypothetical protein
VDVKVDKSRYASIIPTCPRLNSLRAWIACNCQVSRGPIPNRKSSSHGFTCTAKESHERLTRLRKWSRLESRVAQRHRRIFFGRGSKAPTYSSIFLCQAQSKQAPISTPIRFRYQLAVLIQCKLQAYSRDPPPVVRSVMRKKKIT